MIQHLRKGVLCQHSPDEERRNRYRPAYDYLDFGEDSRLLSKCQFSAIQTQAGLIEPISACINAASAQPGRLLLSSPLAIFERDSPLPPNLQALNLSRLHSLEWRTEIFENGSHLPSSAQKRDAFLMALLRTCHLSIQNLRITPEADEDGLDHGREPSWPPKEAKDLPLPNLRSLQLTSSVSPRQLAPWI